jgi:hypothetical protein
MFQNLSNDIRTFSIQCVLTPAIAQSENVGFNPLHSRKYETPYLGRKPKVRVAIGIFELLQSPKLINICYLENQ